MARYLTSYYVSAGEEPGVWRPSAAAQKLGVTGAVDRAQLELLIEGRHPGTGELLGTRFNTDPTSGRRSVAGFDATFSAPKACQ